MFTVTHRQSGDSGEHPAHSQRRERGVSPCRVPWGSHALQGSSALPSAQCCEGAGGRQGRTWVMGSGGTGLEWMCCPQREGHHCRVLRGEGLTVSARPALGEQLLLQTRCPRVPPEASVITQRGGGDFDQGRGGRLRTQSMGSAGGSDVGHKRKSG